MFRQIRDLLFGAVSYLPPASLRRRCPRNNARARPRWCAPRAQRPPPPCSPLWPGKPPCIALATPEALALLYEFSGASDARSSLSPGAEGCELRAAAFCLARAHSPATCPSKSTCFPALRVLGRGGGEEGLRSWFGKLPGPRAQRPHRTLLPFSLISLRLTNPQDYGSRGVRWSDGPSYDLVCARRQQLSWRLYVL